MSATNMLLKIHQTTKIPWLYGEYEE